MEHYINQNITVTYLEWLRRGGITDITLTVTDPLNNILSPIVMTNIGDGFYQATFTPTIPGRYTAFVSSMSTPKNQYYHFYTVLDGLPADDYFDIDGDGNLELFVDGPVFDLDTNGDVMPSIDGTIDANYEIDNLNQIQPK